MIFSPVIRKACTELLKDAQKSATVALNMEKSEKRKCILLRDMSSIVPN